MHQELAEKREGEKGHWQIQVRDRETRLNCIVVDTDQVIQHGGDFLSCENFLAARGLRLMWRDQKR